MLPTVSGFFYQPPTYIFLPILSKDKQSSINEILISLLCRLFNFIIITFFSDAESRLEQRISLPLSGDQTLDRDLRGIVVVIEIELGVAIFVHHAAVGNVGAKGHDLGSVVVVGQVGSGSRVGRKRVHATNGWKKKRTRFLTGHRFVFNLAN